MSSRRQRWSAAALELLAIGYPASLLLVVLALRFIGERWWITGLGLYLPRLGFALPLPLIMLACIVARRPRLLLLQAGAALLLLFPLLGFNLAWSSAPKDATSLRVLSYNVNSGHGGFDAVAAEILHFDADIVLIQELFSGSAPLEAALRARYPFQNVSGQLMVASRFPIVDSIDPARLAFYGKNRSPRFMKYVIETRLGKIAFYNLHTVSPRGGLYAIRSGGFRRKILSGRLLASEDAETLQATAALRELQIQAISSQAALEAGPTVVAGDTNLPQLSPVFARGFGAYRDGFTQARSGFGYTYPTNFPWMRIDRILSNDQLRFVRFEVGKSNASDHHCVVADLVLQTR